MVVVEQYSCRLLALAFLEPGSKVVELGAVDTAVDEPEV